jgi:ADP-heptose:LPS heptosyltransferase/predicted SAM-dependent methyltransferase
MWTDETSKGFESRKCRDRVIEYLHGTILDIGCGTEKVTEKAIGIDANPKADLMIDLTRPDGFSLFNTNAADVVFSSHFLEHVHDYKSVLKEMFRIVKPGGKLILYLPHKDLYPRMGEQGANPDHKHDFAPEDIINAMNGTPYSVIRNKTYSEDDEYSFELILEKSESPSVIERDERSSVLIIRLGAIGDLIQTTPLFRFYAEKGYRVVLNCLDESISVIENNPYVADVFPIQRGSIPPTQLREYMDSRRKQFAKVVDLNESIERTLLLESCDDGFYKSREEIHQRCNVNYSDRIMSLGGMDVTGMRPEIYLSDREEYLGNLFKEKNKGFFKVQWQLTGSSIHKQYPYSESIIDYFIDKYPDIKFYLSGGGEVMMYVDSWNKRVIPKMGKWDVRQSIIMPKFMDLVISPETGVLNAAGAYDTPKIGILTHSSKENLTKYFKNDYSLESESKCAPCHKLLHDASFCNVDERFKLPVCMSEGHDPNRIVDIIEKLYGEWKCR